MSNNKKAESETTFFLKRLQPQLALLVEFLDEMLFAWAPLEL